MDSTFIQMLTIGGKTNSLGKVDEVISMVLGDKNRLDDLYSAMSADDSWVRMRAADVSYTPGLVKTIHR